jgi:hypothetical protein
MGAEMIINTHGQFFFAPNSVYDTVSPAAPLRAQLDLPATGYQYRLLTRNFNVPYTDYGSYWEALTVRAPFSDSFVGGQELAEFDHAQALKSGLTPNWNMAYGVPAINGYTTLLPADYAALWQRGENEPRINFVDRMDPADPLLDEWAVKYYLVDTWFQIDEELSAFPVVAQIDRWQLRERPTALPRIRFADNTPAEVREFEETPVRLRLTIENPEGKPTLLIADRYDADWRVAANGQASQVHNSRGMRLVPLQPGENTIELWYWPRLFFWGVGITWASVLVSYIFVYRHDRTRSALKT